MKEKVVLAYSGGLDTSVAIRWLQENYGLEVVALAVDLGQPGDLGEIREKALRLGAADAVTLDLKEVFAEEYVLPALKANALYEGRYPLATSLARPLIASALVEEARRRGATSVAHGCTGKGNDQVRFELAYKALAPHLKVIAPWREWEIRSREEAIEYARQRNIPVPVTSEKIYSRDHNLWHLSHEGGELEDPAWEPDESLFQLTVSPEAAPDKPTYLEIGFEQGVPVSLDGARLGPVELMEQLNRLGGENGVGRVDLVENRLVGMKSRGVYETPGGSILLAAHRELESLILDRDTLHYKQLVALRYAELVYYGQWFTPLRRALDSFIDATQRLVTGTIGLKLYKGNITVASRRSPFSMYRQELASFHIGEGYDQKDAAGFINIFGLPLIFASSEAQAMSLEALGEREENVGRKI